MTFRTAGLVGPSLHRKKFRATIRTYWMNSSIKSSLSYKSTPNTMITTPEGLDRLSALLDRFRVRAHMFHNGPLCGVTRFTPEAGLGFLHVMRRGTMVVTHRAGAGAPQRVEVSEPSLVFYPRPLAHDFNNAPVEGADFTCATLAFEGGAGHPLARALPALVVLPLSRVQGLEHTLALLFAETE